MSDELQRRKKELGEMADEVRLKLHLATMEARQMWEEKLEPQLRELDRKFDASTKEMREDLGEELGKLEKRIRAIVEDIKD